MAVANSYARLKEDTNSGISTGTSALILCIRPPLSISAPRAFWADMILSVSSIRVGMKRRAMVIIMDSSWTLTWSTLSGLSSRSMASVSVVGEVV